MKNSIKSFLSIKFFISGMIQLGLIHGPILLCCILAGRNCAEGLCHFGYLFSIPLYYFLWILLNIIFVCKGNKEEWFRILNYGFCWHFIQLLFIYMLFQDEIAPHLCDMHFLNATTCSRYGVFY